MNHLFELCLTTVGDKQKRGHNKVLKKQTSGLNNSFLHLFQSLKLRLIKIIFCDSQINYLCTD